MAKMRVIIAGGGFGGLEAAFSLNALLPRPFEITLIDKSPCHTFLPSVHLLLSGKSRPEDIGIPLKTVLGAAGITFVHDELLRLDPEGRSVSLAGGVTAEYDYLVLACGAESNCLDIPGAREFAHRFRSTGDAAEIKKTLTVFLHGSIGPRSVVLAGAGTEGIEAAGEVVDLIDAEGLEDDRASGRITVELIEGRSRLLPNLPERAGKEAEKCLTSLGVRLTFGDAVAEVRKDGIVLRSGQVRDSSYLIWSGGIQPSRLIRDLPFQKDPWGWLNVDDHLQVPGQDRIFGVGDAVAVSTADGPMALQRLASHALDQARVAAINLAARCGSGKEVRYEAKRKPQLISVGGAMGILATEDRVSSGAWVVSMKKAIERSHLLTSLSRPVSSRLQSVIPGAGLLQRLRTKLPL